MRILRILFSLVIFGLIVHVLPTTTTPNVPVSAATNTSNVTAPAGNSTKSPNATAPAGNSTKNVNVTAPAANTTQLALVSSASPQTCKNGNGTHCPSCAYTINVHKDTPKYIGYGILIAFVIFHIFLYFYLEDQKAREQKKYFEELIAEQMAARKREEQDDQQHEDEEKERRERLAYGIAANPYVVAESKTPNGNVTKVMEKRRSAVAPPITPALGAGSTNGPYESRTKTAQKEEAMSCHLQVIADNWGRGKELISLINDLDLPAPLVTTEEKARYALELVQHHVEKMTEQKVFLHGYLDDGPPFVCSSETLAKEIFSDARLELKLELTSPVHMKMDVFSVKLEPQQKTVLPEPTKETPKTDALLTPGSHIKGRSMAAESSKRKAPKLSTDLTNLVPLLQQAQMLPVTEKATKEKLQTPKQSPMPGTPENTSLPPSLIKKKKKESTSEQAAPEAVVTVDKPRD